MLQRLGAFLRVLLALGVVILLAWAVIASILALPRDIAIVLIPGIGAGAGVVYAEYQKRKQAIEVELRKQKTPVYEEFMEFFSGRMIGGSPMTDDEMTEFFRRWTSKVVIWGSDQVVTEYSNWKRAAQFATGVEAGVASGYALERLFTAMRADLGHSNKGVIPGTLLRLFIKDFDTSEFVKGPLPVIQPPASVPSKPGMPLPQPKPAK